MTLDLPFSPRRPPSQSQLSRATGITAYLKNGGTLENATAMANHASTRTTQLYDRRRDDISLNEIERIRGVAFSLVAFDALERFPI